MDKFVSFSFEEEVGEDIYAISNVILSTDNIESIQVDPLGKCDIYVHYKIDGNVIMRRECYENESDCRRRYYKLKTALGIKDSCFDPKAIVTNTNEETEDEN